MGYRGGTLAQNAGTTMVTAENDGGGLWTRLGATDTYLLLGRVRTDALRPLVDYKSKR